VLLNGDYTPILSASADRVDLLCPSAPAGTALAIAVETPAGRSNLVEGSMQSSTPGLFTTGDSGAARASAVRLGTTELASIPSDSVNGKPAFADDILAFRATGVDCSGESAAVGLSMEIGADVVPENAVRPAPGRAGICQIHIVVPPSAAADEVPVTLHATGTDGVKRTSNATVIELAAPQY
jgi:uncharacterized protein (TIGR03437 family)